MYLRPRKWQEAAMAHFFSLIIVVMVAIIWISQILDVLFRDIKYFDNHTHKLTWFLVIFTGSIIGAIWYYLWKRSTIQQQAWQDRAE
jgi:hypothetical protein